MLKSSKYVVFAQKVANFVTFCCYPCKITITTPPIMRVSCGHVVTIWYNIELMILWAAVAAEQKRKRVVIQRS